MRHQLATWFVLATAALLLAASLVFAIARN
jgi:hypothetical protein